MHDVDINDMAGKKSWQSAGKLWMDANTNNAMGTEIKADYSMNKETTSFVYEQYMILWIESLFY